MQEMQETQVWSQDWEDPLEEETAAHSSIPAWEIPWTQDRLFRLTVYSPWGHKKWDMTEWLSLHARL